MAEEPEIENVAEVATKTLLETAKVVNEGTASFAQALEKGVDDIAWIPDSLVSAITLFLLALGMGIIAWIIFAIARPLILRIAKRMVASSSNKIDDFLFGHGVFKWLTHLLPAILIYSISPGLFSSVPILARLLSIASSLYLLLAAYFVIDSILNAIYQYCNQTKLARKLNLGTFVQVVKLLMALVAFVLGIAIIIGKSPVVLLGGIGVFASVLMLVFKDVILGFVAGVQLSSNRMLSKGDWLEMPSHNADGNVEEIGLTTVKVRNWDNTVTTIPTYALISQSFKNWRGMQESAGRRIKRSLRVDTNTIQLCTPEMLDRYSEIEHITEYIQKKKEEVNDWNARLGESPHKSRVNGRRLTNIGTFRAYIDAYLRNHPGINQKLTIIVRQLAPDGMGLPIEVYCFSKNKEWAVYEDVQSNIFDHLLAVAPEFDLRVFQQPTGLDFSWGKEDTGTVTGEEADAS